MRNGGRGFDLITVEDNDQFFLRFDLVFGWMVCVLEIVMFVQLLSVLIFGLMLSLNVYLLDSFVFWFSFCLFLIHFNNCLRLLGRASLSCRFDLATCCFEISW